MAGQFTNPGAAVADTLQDILARKKLEARQAMLDSRQQMLDQKAEEDRQLERQQIEFRNKMLQSDLRFKNIGVLDKLAERNGSYSPVNLSDPELLKIGEELGYFAHERPLPVGPPKPPVPETSGRLVSTELDNEALAEGKTPEHLATPPAGMPPSQSVVPQASPSQPQPTSEQGRFWGETKEDADMRKVQSAYSSLIESMPDFDKMAPIERILRIASVAKLPTNVVAQTLLGQASKGNRAIFDEQTGKMSPATMNGVPLTTNDEVTTRNRPPTPPPNYTIAGVNPTDQTIIRMDRAGNLVDVNGKRYSGPVANKQSQGGGGGGAGGGKPYLDAGESQALARARAAAQSTGNANLMGVYRNLSMNALGRIRAKTPYPQVATVVRDIILDPGYDNIPTQDIINRFKAKDPTITPEELAELANILYDLRERGLEK